MRISLPSRLDSRLRYLARSIRRTLHPDIGLTIWAELIRREGDFWARARSEARGGPAVMIATSTGGHPGVMPVESMLAVALTLRGVDVSILLCDRALPACLQATRDDLFSVPSFVRKGPEPLCGTCFRSGMTSFGNLGLPVLHYGQFVTAQEVRELTARSERIPVAGISEYREENLALGEHALAGALRYFAKGSLESEALGDAVLRRYLTASLMTMQVARRILDSGVYAAWVFHHGIYVPQGVVGEVARSRGVRVINWNAAYRKRCFIFSHGDTYHHTLMHEPTSEWQDLPWTPAIETKLMGYLRSRWKGTEDWIWFHERPKTDEAEIRRDLGIDPARPAIGMLTNVVWDAQLHYPANAFPNMIDWVLKTIRYFEGRPDLQLIIRAHPAEVTGGVPSRQPIAEVIREAIPRLPENVSLIPPQSQISTYVVMGMCDSVIIYGTKTGVELASLGKPVIVAGEAWIRNKGISLDVSSQEGYFRLLDRLPIGQPLDEAAQLRARKYAYHFFFRRMIPLAFMEPQSGWPPYRVAISSLKDLLPGNDKGLDIVCEGILKGSSFVYRDELSGGAP